MATKMRADGRAEDEARPVQIIRGWTPNGEGSVLIETGNTRVLCVASFTEGVPRWKRGSGEGWVTAEYSMLPRATTERNQRESVKGKLGGRTHEISRLIGRSLRASIDLKALGENTVVIDCDVLVADGGTRTAAITGGWLALHDAIAWAVERGVIAKRNEHKVLVDSVAAVSVGVVDGRAVLDLPYVEDVAAETDMNVVGLGSGGLVEVQGTAEGAPFSRGELTQMLDLAEVGLHRLNSMQARAILTPPGTPVTSKELGL